MLLVLSSGGYLTPPDENPDREQLWHETWKRINRFQPNLFAELFPDEIGKPARPRPSKDERISKDERGDVVIAERKSKEVPHENTDDGSETSNEAEKVEGKDD